MMTQARGLLNIFSDLYNSALEAWKFLDCRRHRVSDLKDFVCFVAMFQSWIEIWMNIWLTLLVERYTG